MIAAPVATWNKPTFQTPTCGARVLPVAVLANPSDDARGETVWLRNVEPEAVSLVGWTLARGRSRRPLDDITLAPGERRGLAGSELKPLRLPNAGGRVTLVDPCGLTEVLAWSEGEPGEVAVHPDEGPDP